MASLLSAASRTAASHSSSPRSAARSDLQADAEADNGQQDGLSDLDTDDPSHDDASLQSPTASSSSRAHTPHTETKEREADSDKAGEDNRVTSSMSALSSSASLNGQRLPATQLPSAASLSSAAASVSSLLSLLASREEDLRLAAKIGAALSDRNDSLEEQLRDLERRIAALQQQQQQQQQQHGSITPVKQHGYSSASSLHPAPSPSLFSSTSPFPSSASLDTSDEVLRLRTQLNRAAQRQQLTEEYYKDALSAAKSARKEALERWRQEEKEAKTREKLWAVRLQELEAETERLRQEAASLRAMETQRVTRERELRRSRELREKEEEQQRQQRKEEWEELRSKTEEGERRWREEHRRREETDRRCLAAEAQRDAALAAAEEAALELERRRRRWDEWERTQGRQVEEEVDRHRQQARALAEQYRSMEERLRGDDALRERPGPTSLALRIISSPASPSSPSSPSSSSRSLLPSSASSSAIFFSPAPATLLLSHSTQTPSDWADRLDRSPVAAVPFPHLPSPAAAVALQRSPSAPDAVSAADVTVPPALPELDRSDVEALEMMRPPVAAAATASAAASAPSVFSFTSAAAFSSLPRLQFTLHSSHPSSIHSFLSSPLPALPPLSSSFFRLAGANGEQSKADVKAAASGAQSSSRLRISGGGDAAVVQAFNVLMQTRLGHAASAGFAA